MSGLITTAARLKNGNIISFRHYTCHNFNLCLSEEDFVKTIKKYCHSTKTHSKRPYIKLPQDQAIEKYSTYLNKDQNQFIYGNNFLAPFDYGINFYDYQKKVAFSVNHFSNNVRFLTYYLTKNPLLKDIYKKKAIVCEKDLIRFKMNIPFLYLKDIFKFKEFKDQDILYTSQGKKLDLAGVDTFKAINSLMDQFFILQPEYSILHVNHPEWIFHDPLVSKDSFNMLKDYLIKENILSKNDKLVWDLFMRENYCNM